VRQARVADTKSNAAPGTVLAADHDTMRVSTRDGDLLLSGLTEAGGAPLRSLPRAGERLAALAAPVREKLAACLQRAARGERHWTRMLASLAIVELPYPRERVGEADRTTHLRLPVPASLDANRAPAGFAAWLAAITAQERVTVFFSDPTLAQQGAGLEKWLQAWVPLDVATTRSAIPGELELAVAGQVAAAHDAGPCPRDLPARLGDRHPALDAIRVAVCLQPVPAPEGVDLLLTAGAHGGLELVIDESAYSRETGERIASHLGAWLTAFAGAQQAISSLPLVPPGEATCFHALDATAAHVDSSCVHEAIAAQAARTPHRIAVRFHGQELTYRDLEQRATALAHRLVRQGVRPGDVVGLSLDRTPELVVAMFAIMKAGAAYLPLDPEYPRDRIAFMIEDSAARVVLTDVDVHADAGTDTEPCDLPHPDPARPAYVIYTSGSTGKPKGVVVTHRNVMNFFAGMDPRIDHEPPGRWLAVTSLSFDISVLELCWTLARGFTVVLHSNTVPSRKAPEFSLFYFASDHASRAQERYRLLMEGAKFADQNGFHAVWTPERHFHAFGGLYPNPAVTSAAIAAATTRIQIRAGSCVLPLHHPIRVAEEWAFVDNISQGRVGISFASGWQPNDFVIAPHAFANRKEEMLANIDVVRRLWRGERLPFPGPNGKMVEVQTLPRPIRQELPVWVTAAGNPETFRQAGQLGCHLLTHLLGQTIEDVGQKLRIYRAAWHEAGHAGEPHVTLMLHTFVGDDDEQVRETVRQPMKDYLRSSVDLIRQAAWSFPTFVQRGAQDGKSPVEIMESAPLSDEDMDALLEHAFNRYYGTSALFGTRERCLAMVEKLRDAGVDEIACLIDFGVETQTVLDHLEDIKALKEAARELRPSAQRVSVAEQVLANEITHLQCTPSMASMLLADAPGRAALSRLSALMVGGEALPLKVAKELRALVPGQLINMYGPTETTIWSTTGELRDIGDFVPLGAPIANTTLRIATAWGMDCPALVPGELWIGGAGVAQGYLGRAELTAERFIVDANGVRWYRTGDLVRRHVDGAIEFLGRIDHQVKIRGHRIEPGEIESVLARQPGVKDAVVIARADAGGDLRLLAYVTAQAGTLLDSTQLLAVLAKELPDVMVPQSLWVLPSLPMTPNGKLDRRALPEANAIAVRMPGTAPQGELEKTIAAIWQDVLGLPQVGTSDNFFDLGGHSLLVVQVQRRLREACGREVSITDVFRLPTIQSLAAHLGGNTPQADAVSDGMLRAQARRAMRSRASQPATNPVA
jgi:natural product biosynthesis luciferase-like monooxygenase protein